MNQPFCSPVKALRSVLDAAALLPSPSPETIPLEAACGRIAAADLCARMDQPLLTAARWTATPCTARIPPVQAGRPRSPCRW